MEDQRLSRMYARAVGRELSSSLKRTERWLINRRRALRTVVIVLSLFSLAFGYYAHRKGRFGRLKRELKASGEPATTAPLLIGGQEPLVLQRAPLSDGSMPEFLSATFLPGKGMEPLQLTAAIPGKGTVNLLRAPSVEDVARNVAEAAQGATDTRPFSLQSSLQVPWAGGIPGTTNEAGTIDADWRGRPLHLPANDPATGEAASEGGLLKTEAAEVADHDVMPDGGSVQAHFQAGNFGNRWPSNSEVVVTALLSIRALDLKITVRNAGHDAEPVGIGWLPMLVLPSNSRASATLRVPSSELEEMRGAHASGRLLDVSASASDFSSQGGRRLGTAKLDATYAHLKTGFLDNGPVLELRDSDAGIGLRMTALSQQMQAVHVRTSPSDPGVLQMGFQNNLDDPFSRNWASRATDAITVLQPGQVLEWHVRFELLALSSAEGPPL